MALALYHDRKQVAERVAEAVIRTEARHVLAFTPLRRDTEIVVRRLNAAGVSVAEISGETPKKDRERILASFKHGLIRCVVNVGTMTTGFDFPELDCVILGRPTNSVALAYQMIGRGVRPAPGKECCHLIDLCGNVRRFGRIETFELFDQNGNGMWRLRSDTGFLTGTDARTGTNLEKIKDGPQSAACRVLLFGKYKGTPIEAVPVHYLAWGVTALSGKWAQAFRAELSRRSVRA
jgi:superfamily II DNA or RNA helicase